MFVMRSTDGGKNASGLVKLGVSTSDFKGAHKGPDGNFYRELGFYSDHQFQQFAFTLLTCIEGREDRGYPSIYALPPSVKISGDATG